MPELSLIVFAVLTWKGRCLQKNNYCGKKLHLYYIFLFVQYLHESMVLSSLFQFLCTVFLFAHNLPFNCQSIGHNSFKSNINETKLLLMAIILTESHYSFISYKNLLILVYDMVIVHHVYHVQHVINQLCHISIFRWTIACFVLTNTK